MAKKVEVLQELYTKIAKQKGRNSRLKGANERLKKRAEDAEKLAFDRLKIIERLDAKRGN